MRVTVMRRLLFVIAGIFFSVTSLAQGMVQEGQDGYGILFRQSVKSCDEFMCRFNEEEYFPDLDVNDEKYGKKNFILLFDYRIAQEKGKEAFIDEVGQFYQAIKDNNVQLKFESKKWYAELRTTFVFKKKDVEIGLVFQPEKTPKDLWCWTIVGVNGLEKVGYADSTNRMVISPEQNEAEFIEVESDFKFASKHFSQFRSYQLELDALSYFFALVESGSLTFKNRIETIYYFFDVPSYVFSVKYHARSISNTGWLISSYQKVTAKEKATKQKKLLSK